MYLKKGGWWASLVLSLSNVAAKGDSTSPTPPFDENRNSAAALPPYADWQLKDVPPARPGSGSNFSPFHVDYPQNVSAVSPRRPAVADSYAFRHFSDQTQPLNAAVPRSEISDGGNSQINTSIVEATSGDRSRRRSSNSKSNLASISDDDSAPSGRSSSMLHVDSHDDILSALDENDPFGDHDDVVGGSRVKADSSLLNSADIFDVPSVLPDKLVSQQPPSFPALPWGSFWDFSAWKRVNARPNEVILLTDVDDTLWSSGGWRVVDRTIGGIDREYARGDGYPGITALYFVLAAGRHVTAAANPPRQPANYLLPRCSHPSFRSPLLELCPIALRCGSRGASWTFPFTDSSSFSAKKNSSATVPQAGEVDVASVEGPLNPLPFPNSPTSQHSPAAEGVDSPDSPPILHSAPTSRSSSPTFCAAASFSPAIGIRRPSPARCRDPLVLPPAVGLLTARLSTTLFKGWTRSASFYHDIDWLLEHGARMIYGPHIFVGAWNHGFENNVELMRDTIGGQHSRGRAKVQGFRSALRAGLRPAAQVAASFAAARLQMSFEGSAVGTIGDGRKQLFPISASLGSGGVVSSLNRQRVGAIRTKYFSSGGHADGHNETPDPAYTRPVHRAAVGEGVPLSDRSLERTAPELELLAAFEHSQPARMRRGIKDRSASLEPRVIGRPGRHKKEAATRSDFRQALHYSKPSVCNRAVPVIFGDTGEKDLEVAASVAALSADRLAAVFTHVVFADRDAERAKGGLGLEAAVPRGCVPFTFRFNGVQVLALQYNFDVELRMSQGGEFLPRSFTELDDGQAYAVGKSVALYLREAIALYSQSYLSSLSKLDAMLQASASPAARGDQKESEQPVRAHPLLFVTFSRLSVTHLSPSQAKAPPRSGFSGLISRVHFQLKRKVSALTGHTEEDPTYTVELTPLAPRKKSGELHQWDHGVPIIPYRTTISAATGALLVQMVSLQDFVNVVIASVRDLRSLGRPTSCSNVVPVEDHLFDILAATDLVGNRIRGDAVQNYETYRDAISALRTFYIATRHCQSLSPIESETESPPPKEPPWFSEAEEPVGSYKRNPPLGELQQSPAFEACFTAFTLTGEPSAAQTNRNNVAEAQYRQPGTLTLEKGLHDPVWAAAEYLENQAPGVLPLARTACTWLPQLLHWRSAGGGELEYLSAEWLVSLAQAATFSRRVTTNQPSAEAAVFSSVKGARPWEGGENTNQRHLWGLGDNPGRRLAETTNTESPVIAPADKDDHSVLHLQSSKAHFVQSSDGVPPVQSGSAAGRLDSGAVAEGYIAQKSHRNSQGIPQPLVDRDWREDPTGGSLSFKSAGTDSGASLGRIPLQGFSTPLAATPASTVNEALLQKTSRSNLSSTGGPLLSFFFEPAFEGRGTISPTGNYLRVRDTHGFPGTSHKASESSRNREGGLEDGTRRSGSSPLDMSLQKDWGSAYEPQNTHSASADSGELAAVNDSVACPTLSLHPLIRAMRPICGAQRRQLGEQAPCVLLSRVLYEEKLLSTFNAIQIWIKSGPTHPLYLENIGVTLDPSRPKGDVTSYFLGCDSDRRRAAYSLQNTSVHGRMHLSKLASTVVAKSETFERYNIPKARTQHRANVTVLPFFMDPACNPFT